MTLLIFRIPGKLRRKLLTGLAVVAGVVGLLVVVVALSLPSGSITTADGTYMLELAMLTVPIADDKPLVEAPDQFLGVPHVAP